jgi:hypothetical protein
MCRYWIAPAIEPPGWRAMNQATVLRNWLVLKIHGRPLTAGMISARLWRAQYSLIQSRKSLS